jgi:hypothetical protein
MDLTELPPDAQDELARMVSRSLVAGLDAQQLIAHLAAWNYFKRQGPSRRGTQIRLRK